MTTPKGNRNEPKEQCRRQYQGEKKQERKGQTASRAGERKHPKIRGLKTKDKKQESCEKFLHKCAGHVLREILKTEKFFLLSFKYIHVYMNTWKRQRAQISKMSKKKKRTMAKAFTVTGTHQLH